MRAKMPGPSFVDALPVLNAIRDTVNLNDPQTLRTALQMYLKYCCRTGFYIGNKSLYFACRVSKDTICKWSNGTRKAHDPRFREFANLARQICAAAREQYGLEGLTNPILTIWMQKHYDGFTDTPQIMDIRHPLGDMPDADKLIKKYGYLETHGRK